MLRSRSRSPELTRRFRALRRLARAGGLVLVAACRDAGPDVTAAPGVPLPGLSAADLARFNAGRALFQHAFAPADGLGPLFNEDRCSSCHDLPAIGGTGVETEMKATRYLPPGPCDLLQAQGGDVFQDRATPALRARGVEREPVPPSATGRARVDPPALFGLGLAAAIPDETILARQDPRDANKDGVLGRAGRTSDGAVGRFGQKADHATLKDFVESALRNEMGLTTSRYPADQGVDGAPLPRGVDPAPDPEIGDAQVDVLVAFVRFLAPPAPETPATAAERDSVRRGRQVFYEIGCATCHLPEMRTGPSEEAALNRVTVALYSDLLLHDMGAGLADVCGPDASPSEFRTARLLGLRYRTRYLHDGRAATLDDALRLHGGEAGAARDRSAKLGYADRAYLFKFLSSL